MSKCEECGEPLFSSELDRCRGCIIESYEVLIREMVSTVEEESLRHLNVIHTEVRNRIIKKRD